MTYKCISRLLFIGVIITFVATVGKGFKKSVYEMSDGVIRPSRYKGAKEATLTVIFPNSSAANLFGLPN